MRTYDHKRPNHSKERDRRKEERERVPLVWLTSPGARVVIVTTRGEQIEFTWNDRYKRTEMYLGRVRMVRMDRESVPSIIAVETIGEAFLPGRDFTVTIDGYLQHHCVKTVDLIKPQPQRRSA
ncbi:MAG TPA: hypothetical protein PK911_04425 [Candidatus Saccharibacteria bacterium]|nr:hypothetical protein [Candidatus Saccharibacteria bacterium]